MNLPSTRDCFSMIREMEMMEHIIDHSIMVSNVAVCIGKALRQADPGINIELVRSASLLHDITKTRSFKTGEVHSATGGALLAEKGFPEIGEIIRQHVILDACDVSGPVLEPEIVNYADKRVLHDKVVSLERRLEYIKVRYGTNETLRQRIQSMWEKTLALEKKLFNRISFDPSELYIHVQEDVRRSDLVYSSTT